MSTTAAYIPLSEGDETGLNINGSIISIKCVDSSNDGNFTISFPSSQYINTIDNFINNVKITSTPHTGANFNDVLIIDFKIILSSITYTGNAGTMRHSDFNNFDDITSHENQVIQMNNSFFRLNLNPSSSSNFWLDSTFWSNTNNTSYNNNCNITYDNATSAYESFISEVLTARYNVKLELKALAHLFIIQIYRIYLIHYLKH